MGHVMYAFGCSGAMLICQICAAAKRKSASAFHLNRSKNKIGGEKIKNTISTLLNACSLHCHVHWAERIENT